MSVIRFRCTCSQTYCVDLQATPLHLAVVQNHPVMTAYLLDQNVCLSDNKFGQNSLDVALALEKEDCAAMIVTHKR